MKRPVKQRGHYYVFKQLKRTKMQYLTEVDQSVLLSPGWVFREWFLSPRIPSSNAKQYVSRVPPFKLHLPLETRTSTPQITTPSMPIIFINCQKLQDYKVWIQKASNHLNATAGIAAEFINVMSGPSFPKSATKLFESSTFHSPYTSGLGLLPDIYYGLLCCGAS